MEIEDEMQYLISEDVSSVNYSKSQFYTKFRANKRHKGKGRFNSGMSSSCEKLYFPIKVA